MMSPDLPTLRVAPADDKVTGRVEEGGVRIKSPTVVMATPAPLFITVSVEEAVGELITKLSPVVFCGFTATVPEAETENKSKPAFWRLNKMLVPSDWFLK